MKRQDHQLLQPCKEVLDWILHMNMQKLRSLDAQVYQKEEKFLEVVQNVSHRLAQFLFSPLPNVC